MPDVLHDIVQRDAASARDLKGALPSDFCKNAA
jgi:hypothetical protein